MYYVICKVQVVLFDFSLL